MSLFNLFQIIEKGGPTSGNKGHAGIPGHRGGSAGKFSPGFKNYIKEGFSHNPKLLDKLEKLPQIENGEYLGDKSAHTCQTNAKNCGLAGNDLYVGYVITDDGKNNFNLSSHWFNVKNGKVLERTELDLEKGEDWGKDYKYVGLKVPDNLKKSSYEKIDAWFEKESKKL